MNGEVELQQRLEPFLLREIGENSSATLIPLPGDASTRRYFRIPRESDTSLILAVYPEPLDSSLSSYREVHQLLTRIGLPVPEILACDQELGMVLQEDLGDETLERRLLAAATGERDSLIGQAIAHIRVLQQVGTTSMEPGHVAARRAFDSGKLLQELEFFQTHYLEGYRKKPVRRAEELKSEFQRLSAELSRLPRVLCHRDYQVRNLMPKDGTLYITDFQDARLGPSSYDLVSLLKDSISLEQEVIDHHVESYRELLESTRPRGEFLREFQLMTIQRMLKALGTYAYQITRRKKRSYLGYVEGSLRRALDSLEAVPDFPAIRSLVKTDLDS